VVVVVPLGLVVVVDAGAVVGVVDAGAVVGVVVAGGEVVGVLDVVVPLTMFADRASIVLMTD